MSLFWVKPDADGRPRLHSTTAAETPCPYGSSSREHPDYPCDHPEGHPTAAAAIKAFRKDARATADSFEKMAAQYRRQAGAVVRKAKT